MRHRWIADALLALRIATRNETKDLTWTLDARPRVFLGRTEGLGDVVLDSNSAKDAPVPMTRVKQ